MHDEDIEYVHEHNLPALILGLVYDKLKGCNWRPAVRHADGTVHTMDTGEPINADAVCRVCLDLYDVSATR